MFEPTVITGLPDQVAVGDRVSLTVSGDFTLSGVTLPVEFAVEVAVASTERIEVSGSATVLRSDFGLNVPDVPSVSDGRRRSGARDRLGGSGGLEGQVQGARCQVPGESRC